MTKRIITFIRKILRRQWQMNKRVKVLEREFELKKWVDNVWNGGKKR